MKYDPVLSSSKFYLLKNSKQFTILHLGDLLIDASNKGRKIALDRLIIQFRNATYRKRIDYLIINGNLTNDGKAESFEKVLEVINEFAYNLLKFQKENEERIISLSRIVIIPGENDIQRNEKGEPKIDQFLAFWKSFFTSREYLGVSFKTDNSITPVCSYPYCGDFMDITLLALPHWLLEDGNFSFIEEFNKNRTLDYIEYINATPTILITPPLNEYVKKRNNLKSASLFNRLNTSLQLIGSKESFSLPSSIESIKHMSIGTGKLSEKEPLKACIIYFRPYTSNKPKLRIDNWNYLNNLHIWQRETRFNGKQDQWIPQYQSRITIKPVFDHQIQKIFNEIVTRKIVVVKGFPGSGKSEFFDYIRSNEKDCLYMDIPYDIKDAINECKELIKENTKSKNTILLFRDLHFHERDYEDQEEHIKNFQILLRPLAQNCRGLIYFYSSLGSEENDKIFAKIYSYYGSIRINELDETGFQNLFSQYSRFIPIDALSIQKLSGKFAGYSRLILNGILDGHINDISNHKVIDEDYCNELLANAIFHSNDLVTENKILREKIARIHGGPILIRLIEDAINEKLKQINKLFAESNLSKNLIHLSKDLKIGIDLNKIQSDDQFEKAQFALRFLQNDRIFTISEENRNFYHLNIIVPFLTPRTRPALEPMEF